MNSKFETIIHVLRKIIQLNTVIILKSFNRYYRKNISVSGCKMDLYPAMCKVCLFLVYSTTKNK